MLIIDDEEMIRHLYIDLLEVGGYDVIGAASDGVEGLEIFRSLDPKPDFAIIDYRMPRKNGLDVMREMLRIHPGTKIIFASADASIEDEAMRLGAAVFLKKPFTFTELMEALDGFD
ncbi:MAG TPA: response regulator [Candidatus Syntrophoarchaeum butanivorans]|uniref:Response regulator n=1 Tax=Candidatus Syntropharchaeum butanivorans TaxID=1839936 RepID=A0A1F2P7C7_9EURY|nr:MAG: Signal transduction response regulator, receiver region domain protein [Candidatus Syntrophoarchaeum butanivorans]HEC56339.1 response regulator [Candidatus Syntrophoarchaeum butanivorans]